MFPGMFDPEMMKMAQEQMQRMRPEDLQRMQQMMTPEMTKLAMENMKNMRPEDLKAATEQMKNLNPEQIAQMSSQLGPDMVNQATSAMSQRRQYELNAAASLKAQGNQLHGSGKYVEAAEKYLRAQSNLASHTAADALALRRACGVNLMSCYLKTRDYSKAVEQGNEVLREDSGNVKALYRRGQAYRELGKLRAAVADLKRAAELSPLDETLAAVLSETRKELEEKGEEEESTSEVVDRDGVTIEDVTEEYQAAEGPSSSRRERGESFPSSTAGIPGRSPLGTMDTSTFATQMEALQRNPAMMRQMHSVLSEMDPATLASLSGGQVSPEMARSAGQMLRSMAPEDLDRMVKAAAAMQGGGAAASASSAEPSSSHGVQQREKDSGAEGEGAGGGAEAAARGMGMGPGAMPSISPEMQRHIQEQMKDPEMMKMMSSMLKGLSPEAMAEMSAKAGVKMTPEQARQAQEAMGRLTPEQMNAMMAWAQRLQQVGERARQGRNWLMARPALVLAILVLLIAVLLHYFGFLG